MGERWAGAGVGEAMQGGIGVVPATRLGQERSCKEYILLGVFLCIGVRGLLGVFFFSIHYCPRFCLFGGGDSGGFRSRVGGGTSSSHLLLLGFEVTVGF